MRIVHDRRVEAQGATGAEYALVISFVSLLVIAAVVSLGSRFVTWTSTLADTIATLLS